MGQRKCLCNSTHGSVLCVCFILSGCGFAQADYEVDYTGADCVHEDRQTFYCVPIPAETAWAKAVSTSLDPVPAWIWCQSRPGVRLTASVGQG